jgi:hypothetical protein
MKQRSFRAEREFGLIVGGVFTLLGAWWFYRGKFGNATYVVVPLGILLMLLALIIPRALVYPNRAWMTLAEGMSYVSTRIILAFVFFGVLTPIGLIKRAMGWDPLHRRAKRSDSYWQPYSKRQLDHRHYEKMF